MIEKKTSRRNFLLSSAATAGVLSTGLSNKVLANNITVVNSIRSLSNPYHATWNKGGEAFAKWAGAD